MSSTSSYLNSLLKGDLTEFAETSNLSDYAGLRKAELAEKLDGHLKKNATTYAREPILGEYYKRLSSTGRTPMKRIAEKVSDFVKSDDDSALSAPAPATARKTKRKTRSPEAESSDTEGSPNLISQVKALVKTPAQDVARRTSILAGSVPTPLSPAVVTDAIDEQTKRIRSTISRAYSRTGLSEYSDSVRETLSSTVSINLLAILIEAYGLRATLLPNKLLTEFVIPGWGDEPTRISAPNLFNVLEPDAFWAPFSLWLLTTLIAPALVSYFVNLPLRQLPANSPARRATLRSNPHAQFDPFVFNLAKGLIVYLVYALHFQLIDVYKHATIATVNTSIPGGWQGVLVSSGLGAAVSLYEAVLKR